MAPKNKKRKTSKGKQRKIAKGKQCTDNVEPSQEGIKDSPSTDKSEVKGLVKLPLEVVLDILELSAEIFGTKHARNICLVNQAAYQRCWTSLHRVVALRDPDQLAKFSNSILGLLNADDKVLDYKDARVDVRLRKRQESLHFLYLNNNLDQEKDKPKPVEDKCLINILTVVVNLKVIHFEEHCSRYHNVKSTKHAGRLIENPLEILTSFPKQIKDKLAQSDCLDFRWKGLPSITERKAIDWTHLVPKISELTISADTFNWDHLEAFDKRYYTHFQEANVDAERKQEANIGAFDNLTHLHLYFANLDMLDNDLVGLLLHLPKLTHLRLSLPVSEYQGSIDLDEIKSRWREDHLLPDWERDADLCDSIELLLRERDGVTPLECIIVQVGYQMEMEIIEKLQVMQCMDHCYDRLQIIVPAGYDFEGKINFNCDGDFDSDDDFKDPIGPLCEELGFDNFTWRVWGLEGVWMEYCECLWDADLDREQAYRQADDDIDYSLLDDIEFFPRRH